MTASAPTKEHPIIFSGLMVLAILDGRKTQTRRVIKLHLDPMPLGAWATLICPHGQIGDRLWVREAFQQDDVSDKIWYRADFTEDAARRAFTEVGDGWKPSIHMPRWASRITLEITSVWIERIQDIPDDDLAHEGILIDPEDSQSTLAEYIKLWDSLNAKRGYGWEVNPFVWTISFKRIKP